MRSTLPYDDSTDVSADPRQFVRKVYDHWQSCTPIGEAAAALALAEIQLRLALTALNCPRVNAPHASNGALLTLQEAAEYLRYAPSALRRIAKRKGIQFMQNGDGPIKFRREWLDDFVAANATGPQDVERSAARKYTPRPSLSTAYGFDPSLL